MKTERFALLLSLCLPLFACSSVPPSPEPPAVTEPVRIEPARSGSVGIIIGPSSTTNVLTIESGELVSAPAAAAPRVVSPCRLPEVKELATARVYAAGAYKGRVLDYQIDASGHSATQFDVLVNSPDAPVALLLGAYEPSIWNIEWTAGTRILAVVASGYHRQRVAGIDPTEIPTLLSSYDDGGPCGYFYIGSNGEARVNPLAQRLFGRAAELAYEADRAGRVVIGDIPAPGTRVIRGDGPAPESFRVEK